MILLALGWELSESEETVLTLQLDIMFLGDEESSEGGNTDSEVYIHAVVQLFRGPSCDPLPLDLLVGGSWDFILSILLEVQVLENPFIVLTQYNSLDIVGGKVNLIWIEFALLDNLFDFDDGDSTALGHVRVEVTRGLPEDDVTFLVGNVAFDQSKVCSN